MKHFLLWSFFLLISLWSLGQQETDMTREFVYKGRQYIPNSPWWTTGAGYSYNMGEKTHEPNFFIDVHVPIKRKHYAAVGFLTSRQQFFDRDTGIFLPFSRNEYGLKSIHAMYGWRIERLHSNYGFFAGPSLNWGYDYLYTDSVGSWSQKFFDPGVYASVQGSWKFYFDLGIGTTFWVNWNKHYQAVGCTVHIYFSTAFKRQL
jgi:hypothetical protein